MKLIFILQDQVLMVFMINYQLMTKQLKFVLKQQLIQYEMLIYLFLIIGSVQEHELNLIIILIILLIFLWGIIFLIILIIM